MNNREAVQQLKNSADEVGKKWATYLKVGNSDVEAILKNPCEEVKFTFSEWQKASVEQQGFMAQLKVGGIL